MPTGHGLSITRSSTMRGPVSQVSKIARQFAILVFLICAGLSEPIRADTAWQIIQVREGDSIEEYQLVPVQMGDSPVLVRSQPEKVKRAPLKPQQIDTSWHSPFEIGVTISPTAGIVPSRPNIVRIVVTPRKAVRPIDTARLLLRFDNLSIQSPQWRRIAFESTQIWDTTVVLTVPSNDTSGITASVISSRGGGTCALYFVTTSAPVGLFPGDPRSVRQPPLAIIASVNRAPAKSMATMPVDSSWIGFTDTMEARRYHDDLLAKRKPIKNIVTKEELAELELSPLTEMESQTVLVDSQYFERARGEYKFRPVLTVRNTYASFQRVSDSLFELTADSVIDIWLDLRAVADTNGVGKLVDTLIQTDTSGIYRSHSTGRRLRILRERGIPCDSWPRSK